MINTALKQFQTGAPWKTERGRGGGGRKHCNAISHQAQHISGREGKGREGIGARAVSELTWARDPVGHQLDSKRSPLQFWTLTNFSLTDQPTEMPGEDQSLTKIKVDCLAVTLRCGLPLALHRHGLEINLMDQTRSK